MSETNELADEPRLCHTPEQIDQAARDLVRSNGWMLTPEQRARFTELLRPHLCRSDAA